MDRRLHHGDHWVEKNREVGPTAETLDRIIGVLESVVEDCGDRAGEVTAGREAPYANPLWIDSPLGGVVSNGPHRVPRVAGWNLVLLVVQTVLHHIGGNYVWHQLFGDLSTLRIVADDSVATNGRDHYCLSSSSVFGRQMNG